jgi:hypothetical protein
MDFHLVQHITQLISALAMGLLSLSALICAVYIALRLNYKRGVWMEGERGEILPMFFFNMFRETALEVISMLYKIRHSYNNPVSEL